MTFQVIHKNAYFLEISTKLYSLQNIFIKHLLRFCFSRIVLDIILKVVFLTLKKYKCTNVKIGLKDRKA